MIYNKKNCVIVNPGKFTDLLLTNSKFQSEFNVSFVNLNQDSLIDANLKFKNCNLIIIDNLDSSTSNDEYLSLINHYRVLENKLKNISEICEQYFQRIPIFKIGEKWAAPKNLVGIRISNHIELTKRFFDILIIISLLPIILALITLGVVLIKLASSGPVFFRQERIGKNGKAFILFKLRTMVYNESGHISHTTKNDQRIFPLGRFLRISKIDELPQCLNVLLGEMSIIGPRPERTEIVNELYNENPFYELRHLIRPGITGWAQVNNPVATPNQNFEKLEYDLFYIKNANLYLEILIIIKTIKIILNRKSL